MPVKLGTELAVGVWSASPHRSRGLPSVAPLRETSVREDGSGELVIVGTRSESFKDAELVYRVVGSPGWERKGEKLLGDREPGKHRFKIQADEKKAGQSYSVWAHDRKSGLTSQYAVYREPEKDAPAASNDWVLVETSFEVWDGKTMDEGGRVFSSGRSAETPTKLSRWSIGPEEFSFFNSSTQFKSSARWDKMPENSRQARASASSPRLIEGLQMQVSRPCRLHVRMVDQDDEPDPAVRNWAWASPNATGGVSPSIASICRGGQARSSRRNSS